MINYREKIAEIIAPAVGSLTASEILEMVESPTDSKLGDYAFPCFKLAKAERKAPHLLAVEIAGKIAGNELFVKVEDK